MVGILPRPDQTSLAPVAFAMFGPSRIGVPQRHRILIEAVNVLASGMPNSSLSPTIRFSILGGASPKALRRVPARRALHEGGDSGPNRSSRALAKPARSLVLRALPAVMKVLPNAPLWLVLLQRS